MVVSSVSRVIEQQAASRPTAPALAGDSVITYRELNLRANAVARRLVASGLRRGAIVVIKMEKSVDTAVIMLAVLKAGAAYMWLDSATAAPWPYGVSLRKASAGDDGSSDERWKTLDVRGLVAATQPAPGLPIVTRPTDVACVLPGPDGSPDVLVPHATVTGLLKEKAAIESAAWSDDAGAFGLLLGLMAGATVSLSGERRTAAA